MNAQTALVRVSRSIGLLRFAVILGLLSLSGSSFAGEAPFTNAPRPDFWDTDGSIHAVLATNGLIYVGGFFSYVAPKGRNAEAIDVYTATRDSQFPAIAGSASAIADDGNGGWFIGGRFTRVGGLARTNLVHILSDNSVDLTFQSAVDAPVRALALDNGTLFIGGEFSSIDGQARTRLAAMDVRTQLLSSWAPLVNGGVSNLLVAGETIYVGGLFTTMGGQPRNNIAALDRNTGMATAWNPNANGVVQTMALLEERLYVGGFFTTIGGIGRFGLAALDIHQDTANATAWNPNPDGKVTVLRVTCSTVYVGGYFSHIGSATRYRAAAIDINSGLPTLWNPNLDPTYSSALAPSVQAIEVSGERVYLCGQFTITGPQTQRRDLAAVDAITGVALAWNPNVNGGINTLSVAGRSIVAGFLNSPGGKERHNLAAFDAITGRVTDWNPSALGPPDQPAVLALTTAGGTIYAGGNFTNVGGLSRNSVAAIDAVTGQAVTDWNPNADGTVHALASDGARIFAGGSFLTVNGVNRRGLAALDASSGQLFSAWPQTLNGSVRALSVSGTTLYAGGSFTVTGGSNRQYIAALNIANNGQVLPWNPNSSDTVNAIAVSSDAVYVGGVFAGIGGQPRDYVAALNPISGLATTWNPGADGEISALALFGDAIYMGGSFQNVDGQPRLSCAAVDVGGTLLDWNPGASSQNQVFSLAATENALYVGGNALEFDNSPCSHSLGVFARVGAPVILEAPADQIVLAGADAMFSVQVNGQEPFSYQWRFNGNDLLGQSSPMLLLGGVSVGQSGRYQVVVTNALGAITAEATLTVMAPVIISNQPTSLGTTGGVAVTLSVGAAANPPPIYQWRLNGANIPGAVFPTLTLSNVTPTSGGSYYVAVGNSLGAINSEVAEVAINSVALPFGANSGDAGAIGGFLGVGSGSNVLDPPDSNEVHAGKRGGKSVWLKWTAPANGIATFSTRGSGFDTLLEIYTNGVAGWGTIASDDDRGGFFTSRASFNAVAGVEYVIAVDGLAGASGKIVLSWNLDTTVAEFPRIMTEPLSRSVSLSNSVSFEVVADSPTPMTYQWFFGCQQITGATNSLLVISNVQTRHVGSYRVVIMNSSSRIAESLPAALEIGPDPGALSFDKLEELNSPDSGKAASPNALASSGGAILVSMGSIVSQTFDTTGYRSGLRETNHCGIIGGASAWLKFQPTQTGTVLVDTIGSSFDTILAVYRDTNLLVLQTNLSAARVECDNNSAPDHIRSLLTFHATGGTRYLAVVDGVNGATGPAVVHWQLGSAPTVMSAMTTVTQRVGRVVTLASGVTSTVPSIKYQWRLNGTNVPGATSATLTLSNLTTAQAGTYSVIASNFAGVITNICAALTVNPPLRLENMAWLVNRRFNCEIKGASGELFALQASTDLKIWQTLLADQLISESWNFTDTNAHLFNQRFYRVIPSIVLEPSLIWTNGATHLQITSKSSEPCILQTTTNLADWTTVYTNSAFTPLQFLERPATNSPALFYRGMVWP